MQISQGLAAFPGGAPEKWPFRSPLHCGQKAPVRGPMAWYRVSLSGLESPAARQFDWPDCRASAPLPWRSRAEERPNQDAMEPGAVWWWLWRGASDSETNACHSSLVLAHIFTPSPGGATEMADARAAAQCGVMGLTLIMLLAPICLRSTAMGTAHRLEATKGRPPTGDCLPGRYVTLSGCSEVLLNSLL